MVDNREDNFSFMMDEIAIEEYKKEESALQKYMEDYNLSLKDVIINLSNMLLSQTKKDEAVLLDKELDLLIVIKGGIYKKGKDEDEK